jgi:hypothetical protein
MIHKLRFGIMCAGDQLPAAFAASVRELLEIEGVEPALLILDVEPSRRTSILEKIKTLFRLKGLLWAAYRRLYPLHRLSCYRPVDMSQTLAGVPRISCRVIRKGTFSQYFQAEDVAQIREYRLDFILRFAFGIIRGDILRAATYGVWSFHYGDESKFRGGPPGFWEIYCNDLVTGAILQRLTDRLDAGVVLQRCFLVTHKFSQRSSENALLWAAAYMPARVCRDILNGSASYLQVKPSRTEAPIRRAPDDLQMLRFMAKTIVAWIKWQTESILMFQDWNIGVVRDPVEAFLQPGFIPEVRWLPYRKRNCFIADPFVARIAGRMILLAEEFDGFRDRGRIMQAELGEAGTFVSPVRKAIDEGVHMSYPNLFSYKGKTYCTPECSAKRGVYLYVFDPDREEWSPAAQIIENFAAVDPTLFEYEGRWWLFCSKQGDCVDSKLYLWHASDPFGPWEPHTANPVKCDVRSARPAGRPFLFEGNLYRPAQDSSRAYGGGITISRVTDLNVREYREEPAAAIYPSIDSRYPKGIHTLAGFVGESFTIVDGYRLAPAPALISARLRSKISRLIRGVPDTVG